MKGTQKTTVEYLNEFPAIYQPLGYILAAIDTLILYPHIRNFEDEWLQIHQKIITKAFKLKDTSVTQYLSQLDENSKFFFYQIFILISFSILGYLKIKKKLN